MVTAGRESSLEGNDMVARLDAGDALAHGLDDAGALMSEDDGECALGILAGERVPICGADVSRAAHHPPPPNSLPHQTDQDGMRRHSFRLGDDSGLVDGESCEPVWQTPV